MAGFLEWAGFGNEGKTEKANEAIEANKKTLQQGFNTNEGLISDYMDSMRGMYGSAPEAYKNALDAYMNNADFAYNKNTKEFFSPAYEQRVKEAMNNITKSQANAGNMFSSDYLNSLNAKSQAMASEEWDKAFERMQRDRSNALEEYRLKDSKLSNIASMLSNDQSSYANALGSYYTNRINNSNALTQGIADLNTQIAQNNLNKKSSWQALLNPFG